MSPLDCIRLELYTDYQAANYSGSFFENAAIPAGVIEVDIQQSVDEDTRKALTESWNKQHRGTNKVGKIAILSGGMKYNPIGLTAKDMEFISGRQFTRDVILAVFGVPETILGLTSEQTFANAAQAKKVFWSETLIPAICRIEEKLNSEFFGVYAPELSCKFNLLNIPELNLDFTEKITQARQLMEMGYTANEANERVGLRMEQIPELNTRYVPPTLVEMGMTDPAAPNSQGKSIIDINVIDKTITQKKTSPSVISAQWQKLHNTETKQFQDAVS